jgi:uncharacterized membrane protein
MSIGAIILTFAICFAPITVIFSVLPYIGRRTLTFGVSIPSGKHDDARLKKMRSAFSRNVIVLGVLMSIISVFLFLYLETDLAIWLTTGLVMLDIVFLTILYVRNFKAVSQIKEEQGWAQDAHIKSVADTKFSVSKRSVSALWFLLYIVIIIGTLLLGIVMYDQMPNNVVMQTDFDGNATRIVEKSIGLIMFAPAIQAIMALLMGFVYWMMQRTPPVIDPEQPEVSSAQNTKFRYRWSAYIVFSGIILLFVFLAMQLNFIGVVPQSLVVWAPLALSGVIVVVVVVLAIKTGQSGSRIRLGKTTDGKVIDRNDDKFWRWGLFYVNKQDTAMFVEKRFGVGFTINFGRPAAVAIFVVVIALVVAAVVVSSLLAG